jgi:hypothetical protein
VTRVNPTLLNSLVASGYIPVVATVATDEAGQALNVNADTAAGEIAAALQAEKLILMTDVPGVLRDKDDVSTKFAELNIKRSRELMQEGIIAGGMIPKARGPGGGDGDCSGWRLATRGDGQRAPNGRCAAAASAAAFDVDLPCPRAPPARPRRAPPVHPRRCRLPAPPPPPPPAQVQCCVRCISQGVNAAHIIDGRSRHSILMELLTDEGVGTMITG